MTASTGRGADWFEDGIEALQEEPWADAAADEAWGADLTDDQRAVLEGLEDQPPVPRLKSL